MLEPATLSTALMLLTSARFPSRLDDKGALLRLDEQDRSKWDAGLINEGLQYLAAAAQGAAQSGDAATAARFLEHHLYSGEPADAELVAAMAEGDRGALATLYGRYAGVMLAVGVLECEPDISDEDLLDVLSSNLCRCTGYQNIIKAVRQAAIEMRGARK